MAGHDHGLGVEVRGQSARFARCQLEALGDALQVQDVGRLLLGGGRQIAPDEPAIPEEERLTVTGLAPGIYSVTVRFGFRENPDLSKALRGTVNYQLELPRDSTTFFVARTSIVDCEGVLPYWRCALFGWMMRQSESAATYFNLPTDQVVEIGTQVTL